MTNPGYRYGVTTQCTHCKDFFTIDAEDVVEGVVCPHCNTKQVKEKVTSAAVIEHY